MQDPKCERLYLPIGGMIPIITHTLLAVFVLNTAKADKKIHLTVTGERSVISQLTPIMHSQSMWKLYFLHTHMRMI